MSQTTDGTQVAAAGGNGDLISDEDMTSLPRLSPLVPQLGAVNANYKIERTKIALGDYSQDRGDPSSDGGRPFPIETFVERRLQEEQYLRDVDRNMLSMISRQRERVPTMYFARSGREGRM